jgi:1,4-dihydroxy-2-naphthoyl-CoA synthase
MIEIILLTVGSFFSGYLVAYLVMTVGVKQDKE